MSGSSLKPGRQPVNDTEHSASTLPPQIDRKTHRKKRECKNKQVLKIYTSTGGQKLHNLLMQLLHTVENYVLIQFSYTFSHKAVRSN